MKELGAECYRIMMRNTIQLWDWHESSKSGGTDGTLHITDSDGNPNLFKVDRNDDKLWLNDNDGRLDNRWNGNNRFVFLRRKSFHFSLVSTREFCLVIITMIISNTLNIAYR